MQGQNLIDTDSSRAELLGNLFQDFSTSRKLRENEFRKSIRGYLENSSRNGHLLKNTKEFFFLSEITERHFNKYRERILEIIASIILNELCEQNQPFSLRDYYAHSRRELNLRLMESRVQEQLSSSEYEEMDESLKVNYNRKRQIATRAVNRHYDELLQSLFPTAVIPKQSDKNSNKKKHNSSRSSSCKNNNNNNDSDHPLAIISSNNCSSGSNYDHNNFGESDNLIDPQKNNYQNSNNNNNNLGSTTTVFNVKKDPSQRSSHETKELELESIVIPPFVEESNDFCVPELSFSTSPNSSSSAPSTSSFGSPKPVLLHPPPPSFCSRHVPVIWDDIFFSPSMPNLMNYFDLTTTADHHLQEGDEQEEEEKQQQRTVMTKEEPMEQQQEEDYEQEREIEEEREEVEKLKK
jgi:hypothetical protein